MNFTAYNASVLSQKKKKKPHKAEDDSSKLVLGLHFKGCRAKLKIFSKDYSYPTLGRDFILSTSLIEFQTAALL